MIFAHVDGASNGTHEGDSRGRQSRGSGQGGRGRGRGGHPPWLKGKDIGLYYKKKSQASSSHNSNNSDRATHAIRLNPRTEQKIKNLLESMKNTHVRRTPGTDAYEGIDSKLTARYDYINDSHFKKTFLEIVSGDIQQNLSKSMLAKSKLQRDSINDKKTLEEHKERVSRPAYQNMLKFREKLPAFKMKRQVLDLVEKNQVVVISGETGTQIFVTLSYSIIISQFFINCSSQGAVKLPKSLNSYSTIN